MILRNPKNPAETIESPYSNQEAKVILKDAARVNPRDHFLVSLSRVASPTPGQTFWLQKLALKHKQVQGKLDGPPTYTTVAGMSNIIELFKTARANELKYPRITFILEGDKIVLKAASNTSTNPGFVYVSLNDEYVGKINPQGVFFPKNCPEKVNSYLLKFNADPDKISLEYGRATGVCCFCGLLLTDFRSIAFGRGPICSRKFGLVPPY